MLGRMSLLSLILCLSSGLCLAQEDVLTQGTGKTQQGKLIGYSQDSFDFAVQQGGGIFLGQLHPAEQVANIVVSSSEDQIYLLCQELASDPVLQGASIETPDRPLDVLQTKTNETRTGRVEGYTDGIVFFRTSDPREADAVDLIPIEEIESFALSNEDFELQRKYEQLDQLVQSRYANEGERQQRLKRVKELRELTARVESERAKKVSGNIYQDMDMSQYYKGNTFDVSPGLVIEEVVDPTMQMPGDAASTESYWESSVDRTNKDRSRERLQERLDANRRRTRNLAEPTPRRSRSDSRSTTDRTTVRTRTGTSIPSIKSVQTTTIGENPVTIIDYER